MMEYALTHARLVTKAEVLDGCAVIVVGSRVSDIVPNDALPGNIPTVDLQGKYLLPGFVDVQLNGGGGVLFNDTPTISSLRTMSRAHARFGTTGFMATLISADSDTISAAIHAVDEAIAAGVPGVLGLHVEGPYLSEMQNGIHDVSNFREMDATALSLLSSAKLGRTAVTLAPEIVDVAMVEALVKSGVIVCIGHSGASYETTLSVVGAGARGFTHLYNAMPALSARAPGVIGAALECRKCWCGVIADGRHVHASLLRLAYACKQDRLMLVTDAMPPVGTAMTAFTLQGKRITVENGVCVSEDGTLGGSVLDMASAFRNAREMLGVDLPQAVRLSSSNAAAFLGLEKEIGDIRVGMKADFVLCDDDFCVTQTWIAGRAQL